MTYLHINPELMVTKRSFRFGFKFHYVNYFSYDVVIGSEWKIGHHTYSDEHIKSRDIYLGFIKVQLYRTFDGTRG